MNYPARSEGLLYAIAAIFTLIILNLPLDAHARTQSTCDPYAYYPWVGVNDTGAADGDASCGSGAPSYYYTIELKNRAGSALATSSGGPVSGTGFFYTSVVSCAGAYVRAFLYINVGGQGKSHTSNENADCAY